MKYGGLSLVVMLPAACSLAFPLRAASQAADGGGSVDDAGVSDGAINADAGDGDAGSAVRYLVWAGGRGPVDGGDALTSDIYVSRINPDASIGPWTRDRDLPAASDDGSVIGVGKYLFLLDQQHVYVSSMLPSGTISPFVDTQNDLPGLREACAGVSGNRVYAVASNGTSVAYASIGEGLLGGWRVAPLPGFPAGNYYAATVVLEDRIVAVGQDVLEARLNADGSPQPWVKQAAPRFSGQNYGVASVPLVRNGTHIYLVGGFPSTMASMSVNDVTQTEALNGGTGSWLATEPFLVYRNTHSAVVASNHIYVVGGRVPEVSFSAILPDHSLQPWRATTAFPQNRRGRCRLAVVQGP